MADVIVISKTMKEIYTLYIIYTYSYFYLNVRVRIFGYRYMFLFQYFMRKCDKYNVDGVCSKSRHNIVQITF